MKLHPTLCAGLFLLFILHAGSGFAQNCNGLTATYTTTESRCTATGSIKIKATGGSGTYNYRVQGPGSADFTSSSDIGGLPGGTYTVTVKDIVSNCTFQIPNVTIAGTYVAPRFGITETDVTCANGQDGTISVSALLNGRAPYTFTLVAPSPMGVGTHNSTGTFTGLKPGSYSMQMTDSCGAIQTRTISIQNYTWSINSKSVTLSNCTTYNGQIILKDSKGTLNSSSGSSFTGFQYGVVKSPGDTTWFSSYSFAFDLAQKRSVGLVAKDRCGLVQATSWSNTAIPSISTNVTINGLTCTGFNAAITNPQNVTNPSYCLVDGSGNPVAGQPCNATGSFTNIPYGSYSIKLTNSCYDTVITRPISQARAVPSITGAVSLTTYTCTTVKAIVTGQQHVTSPTYCLFNSAGIQVGACNSNGIFANTPYGTYTIKMTDGCTGTVIPIPFTAAKKVRSVGSVSISSSSCTTFNATVTGATNLTTPQYCLTTTSGVPIPGVPCNSTGVFNNLPYGSYCINITDACNDTSIQRCINVAPIPPTAGSIVVSNKTCMGFTATLTGEANVFNGQYCLQDQAGHPVTGIPCNSTGIFTNVPYGTYCIKSTDGCTGNSYVVCTTVAAPVPSIGPVLISDTTCSGFTATVSAQQNLTAPNFCLYDALNNKVSCNSTGVFAISTYGSYTIKTTDGCAGTPFTSPFKVIKPIPSAGTAVNLSNQACTSFSAAITGQKNLANAHYYLRTNTGTAVSDNATGIFDNIAYGSYCIDIITSCHDTTISRCFNVNASPTLITLTTQPSCTYASTDLTVSVTSGYSPYTVKVYDTLNTLLTSTTSSNSTIVITGLPTLITAQRYKVVVSGSCGTPATSFVAANPSTLRHIYTISPKCPSSILPNGSADLSITATTSLSSLNLSITQKNFSPVSIGYSFSSGSQYTFNDLESATYVVTYSFPGCTATVNDTVVLPGYAFPDLAKSAAYQCDNNSFSVGASVNGGIGPFTYEVIGSSPATPSISAASQTNPVFTINNGVQYSLIRLRAMDACGNAALNDVSILPLANTIVTASSNCIYQGTTLSTGVVPNATYTWYKKTRANSPDSTLVGTGTSYTIAHMAISDTGVYISRMSVNNGCLTQLSYFHLNGDCGGLWVLPISISLTGVSLDGGANRLSWTAPIEGSIQEFTIERSNTAGSGFTALGSLPADQGITGSSYTFSDKDPLPGINYYRLRIQLAGSNSQYSNIISLASANSSRLSVYPNPARQQLNISIEGIQNQRYSLNLYTITGQVITTDLPSIVSNGTVVCHRNPAIRPGVYLLEIKNIATAERQVFKVIFE